MQEPHRIVQDFNISDGAFTGTEKYDSGRKSRAHRRSHRCVPLWVAKSLSTHLRVFRQGFFRQLSRHNPPRNVGKIFFICKNK
jgi:hypothetical protein